MSKYIVNELLITDDHISLQHHLVGILLNHISSGGGLKRHGEGAKEALFEKKN